MPDIVKNMYERFKAKPLNLLSKASLSNELLPKNLKRESKLDKNYKKHHIQPNSMICCIGGTGSGKC